MWQRSPDDWEVRYYNSMNPHRSVLWLGKAALVGILFGAGVGSAQETIEPLSLLPKRTVSFLDGQIPPTRAQRFDSFLVETKAGVQESLTRKIGDAFLKLQKDLGSRKGRQRQELNVLLLRAELVSWSTDTREEAIEAALIVSRDMKKVYGKKTPPLVLAMQNELLQLKAGSKSTAALDVVIAKAPNSVLAAEAHALIGDRLFHRGDWVGARPHYLAALGFKGIKRREWLALKLSIAHFGLEQDAEATAGAKSVSRSKVKAKGEPTDPQNAARRLLLAVYAEKGDVTTGTAALEAFGGSTLVPELKWRIGAILALNPAKAAKAMAVFSELLASSAKSDQAAAAKLSVVALMLRGRNFGKALVHLRDLGQQYGPKSEWQNKQREDGRGAAEVTAAINRTASEAADIVASSSLKARGLAAKKLAAEAYSLQLSYEPRPKDLSRVLWLRGHFRQEARLLAEAGEDFDAIVVQGSEPNADASQKKFLEPAARRAILVYKSVPHVGYIAACKRFASLFPGDTKMVRECDLTVPKIHLALGEKQPAAQALALAAKKYATVADGPAAVKELFAVVAKDSAEQGAYAAELLTVPAYRTGVLRPYLEDLAFRAELTSIRTAKSPEERLLRYDKLVSAYPKHPAVTSVLSDMAAEARSLNLLKKAADIYALLVESRPGGPLERDATFAVAELSERLFDLSRAEVFYSRYFEKSDAKDARYLIAEERRCSLRVASDHPQALEACGTLAQRDARTAKAQVERIIAKAASDGRVAYLNELINSHYLSRFSLTANEQIGAHLRIFRAFGGKGPEAERARAQMLKTHGDAPGRVTGRALNFIAEMKYGSVKVTQEVYEKVSLEGGAGSVDRLIDAVNKKQKSLDNLVFNFAKVVALGDPGWSSACNFEMGKAYESFADMLRNPPVIEGVHPAHVAQRLQDNVAILEGEAARYYKAALALLHRGDVFNEIGVKAYDGLNRLRWRAYRFDDWLEAPAFFGSEASPKVAQLVDRAYK